MSPQRDKASIAQLCSVYLRNVDPIIKILHRPSLSKWMLDGDRYLGYPEDHTSVQALESAVCYAAANTLTEEQCKSMFQTTKSNLVSTYRGQCEVAFERVGLLMTRDRIVLQSFLLYLIGRRSGENSTAVWTLATLAVRLAMAMGLNQEPSDGTAAEPFFHQQMRLRLWLTICLVDLHASFAQSTRPLISYQEVELAVSRVRHINDFDFDLSTSEQLPDKEELTETTFALVTYRAQVAGRLLNFPEPEKLDGASRSTSGASSPAWAAFPNQEQRRKYVSQFQQQALVLLHLCDPESSSYAWFTWHSTQCLVSAMRLSELLPYQLTQGVQTPASSPSPLRGGDTDLLRRTLRNLEKAELMYSDPRCEGFRWYIAIPWLALSTAIAECNTCTDIPLVYRAWPVIEASYQQYESYFLNNCGEMMQCPLALSMNQTRQRLSSRLQADNPFEHSPGAALSGTCTSEGLLQSLPDPSGRESTRTPVDPLLGSGNSLPNRSPSSSEASYIVSTTQPLARNRWDTDPISMEYTPGIGENMGSPSMYHSVPSSDLFESSWAMGDMMTAYLSLEEDGVALNGDRDRESHLGSELLEGFSLSDFGSVYRDPPTSQDTKKPTCTAKAPVTTTTTKKACPTQPLPW